MRRIVVIGGGAAGASAAARARRLDPEAEVLLIEKTDMITHAPCGIPYAVEGLVKSREDLVTYTPEEFERERKIRVLINTEVVDIDPDKKKVSVKKGDSIEEISWDKLVLATGAIPATPKVPGIDLRDVMTIRHPAETDFIKRSLEDKKIIGIIGGGYIGIEMAEALLRLGKKVIMIEMTDQVLPTTIDKDLAEIISKYMIEKGIDLRLSERLIEIRGKERVEKIVTDKNEYKVDAVIIATGVRPNTYLTEKIGIKRGVTGAVEVNEFMETNIEDIYAAGDLVEKYHKILKKKVWIPLAPAANKEGQVAGANAAKGRILRFPGVVGTAATKFEDLYIARTGVSEKEAVENNIKYEAKTIRARTKAHYYPGGVEVYIKMLIEENSKRIIGAQAVGRDPVVISYIDIMSIVIEREMNIEDLFFSDLSYMPATAPVWHPLIVAARVLSKGVL